MNDAKTPAAKSPPPITAVVLAGGSGRRLGGIDKALLVWRGRSFIEHIVERIAAQAPHVLINSNRSTPYPGIPLPTIADPWPEQRGPLAGVLAGLDASEDEWVLFVPCDCPLPATDLAHRLWGAIGDNIDIAYAGTGADNHYLFCLMRRELRENLRNHLMTGGGAVHRWMKTQRAIRVDFADEADCFLNINAPAELDALLNRR